MRVSQPFLVHEDTPKSIVHSDSTPNGVLVCSCVCVHKLCIIIIIIIIII